MAKSITIYKFVINRTPRSLATQNFGGVCAQRAKHGRQCGNERTEQHGTRLRGGLSGIQRNPEGRRVRRVSTREIKGIDGNVQLNRAL